MKTIGQVLRQQRQQSGLSLAQLARTTSIPLDFLEALENQDYTSLPPGPLVQGYGRLLSTALQIPEETITALLRRDLPKFNPNLRSHSERWPLRLKHWWRPQMLSSIVVLLIVLGASFILLWQWPRLGSAPNLVIVSPDVDQETALTSPVMITGQTDPQVTLTINSEIVSLNPKGEFSYQLPLPPGERSIVVKATDAQGRLSEKVLFIEVFP